MDVLDSASSPWAARGSTYDIAIIMMRSFSAIAGLLVVMGCVLLVVIVEFVVLAVEMA